MPMPKIVSYQKTEFILFLMISDKTNVMLTMKIAKTAVPP